MNNLDTMIAHIGRSSEKTLTSMKDMFNLVKEKEGLFFDEFMKVSENDMRELYPDVLWYCDSDILATRNVMKNLEAADMETAEEKKERERESYLKYKEFVMKKKGHKGGLDNEKVNLYYRRDM